MGIFFCFFKFFTLPFLPHKIDMVRVPTGYLMSRDVVNVFGFCLLSFHEERIRPVGNYTPSFIQAKFAPMGNLKKCSFSFLRLLPFLNEPPFHEQEAFAKIS